MNWTNCLRYQSWYVEPGIVRWWAPGRGRRRRATLRAFHTRTQGQYCIYFWTERYDIGSYCSIITNDLGKCSHFTAVSRRNRKTDCWRESWWHWAGRVTIKVSWIETSNHILNAHNLEINHRSKMPEVLNILRSRTSRTVREIDHGIMCKFHSFPSRLISMFAHFAWFNYNNGNFYFVCWIMVSFRWINAFLEFESWA